MSRPLVTAGPEVDSLAISRQALLVLDIDEVVLHFIEPFCALLEESGARLRANSFHLTGNVRSVATGAALAGSALDAVTMRLYAEQETRQLPVDGVGPALERLSDSADIVFLTAMTPSYYPQRRRLLDAAGLGFPMIATERSKGAVVAELGQRWSGPIVFADDLPPNLASVGRSLPRARLVHLMANDMFRRHLPPLPEGAESALDWAEAKPIMARLLAG
ncbi:hypothetical protein Sa4125_20110 [Aureimonas sp. SA4125]|uniref:hypothetical protein n=1 Tax=Aureimonas sp. SA4125 TaxID=2826993 RepID=UPI001CC567C4|nr:hypothetical protein [Aureimonas sp. SA4125]BDA84469.1 hypothetical protein Sa4125_20110 [Aureimonas sp. SA4125]